MQAVIHRIKKAFEQPLPGREAQYQMAHAFRGPYPELKKDARRAGVLLLLFPKNDQWHTVFIQRPSKNPNDRHAGQLSFPGGKYEEIDEIMEVTALRESEEEVGVAKNKIALLGALTELYIPVSNFLVSPFVGFVEERPEWIPQEEEVADIIEFSLERFRDPAIKGQIDIHIQPKLRLQQVPYFDLNGKVLWGATAMIMNEFLNMNW